MTEVEDKLLQITASLGMSYKQWKDGEKSKDKFRKEFFALADQYLANEVPDERIVTVGHAGMSEDECIELAFRLFPEWSVEAMRPSTDGWEVILIENPEYKAFSFVNPNDGKVYTKQVTQGSVYVDDVRLRAENPELWKAITILPHEGWIKNVIYHCGTDSRDVNDQFDWYVENLPDAPARELRPLGELEDGVLAELQEYIYYGKPTIKLPAPRKAKPEDSNG